MLAGNGDISCVVFLLEGFAKVLPYLRVCVDAGVAGSYGEPYEEILVWHYTRVDIGDISWCHFLHGGYIEISSHSCTMWRFFSGGFYVNRFDKQKMIQTSNF